MDFIEKLFGISPDGGDGWTELSYIAVFILALTAALSVKIYRRRAKT
jgi:hypothetical protein